MLRSQKPTQTSWLSSGYCKLSHILVVARGASKGFVSVLGGKKPPSLLPHLINSRKLFLRLYFSCSTTLISSPNHFASKSNLLN